MSAYSIIALIVLTAFLGAAGRRISGGVLNQWFGFRVFGTTVGRVIWATLCTVAPAIAFHAWPVALVTPAIWIGSTIGLFDGLGLGRGTDDYWTSFRALTDHGLYGAFPLALVAWWFTGWWMVPLIAGALCAPLYEIGYRLASPRLPVGFQAGSEIGELLYGAAVGIGALVPFLLMII